MKNNIAEEKKLEIVFEEIVEDNTMISAIRETDGTEKLRITWIEKQKRENIMRNYELPFKTLAKTEDKITGITTLYGYNNSIIEYNGLGLVWYNISSTSQENSIELIDSFDFEDHKTYSSSDSGIKLYQNLFQKKPIQKIIKNNKIKQ